MNWGDQVQKNRSQVPGPLCIVDFTDPAESYGIACNLKTWEFARK